MITTAAQLREYITLSDDEADALDTIGERYPWRITDYYAALIDPDDMKCPLRKQAVPSLRELDTVYGAPDPLSEEQNSPVPGVIHVYPDRVAVVVTERCPMYCRHCLRKRYGRTEAHDLRGERLERALGYIAEKTGIRDVLLTGGDPLMLTAGELDTIIGRVMAIPHVEIARVGTRMLCTDPSRVSAEYADMLAAHKPLWVNTQFNHPREVTADAAAAADMLLTRGIPVQNQSVLLAGVNDSAEVMRELVQTLVKHRIRPYYMYQAQTLSGTEHFVAPIEQGLDIIRSLRGRTTGFAIPQYVVDTPYGKIPLDPNYIHGREGDYMVVESWDGQIHREYNPLDTGSERRT